MWERERKKEPWAAVEEASLLEMHKRGIWGGGRLGGGEWDTVGEGTREAGHEWIL